MPFRRGCFAYGLAAAALLAVPAPETAAQRTIDPAFASPGPGDGVSLARTQCIQYEDYLHCVGSLDTPGYGNGIAFDGSHVYVADGEAGLQVLDVTDPARPRIIGSANVSRDQVYFADDGLIVAPTQCQTETAVHLSNLTVERAGGQAVVRWSISMPQAHAAFRVWRDASSSVRTLIGEAVRVRLEAYEITDDHPPSGPADYWLQERSLDGADNWYGPVHLPAAAAPAAVRLYQNQPNPFNPRTTIRYSLPRRDHVTLAVYDLRGARITTLVDADLSAGEWKAEWDGHDARNRAVSSGVYLARLETTNGTQSVKMLVTK